MRIVFPILLVLAALILLSAVLYVWLQRFLPRWAAALVAPAAALLAGSVYAAIGVIWAPPDTEVIHLLILLPPFVLGLYPPAIAATLLWVFLTRRWA